MFRRYASNLVSPSSSAPLAAEELARNVTQSSSCEVSMDRRWSMSTSTQIWSRVVLGSCFCLMRLLRRNMLLFVPISPLNWYSRTVTSKGHRCGTSVSIKSRSMLV